MKLIQKIKIVTSSWLAPKESSLKDTYNSICTYCGKKVIDHKEEVKGCGTTMSWEILNSIRTSSCYNEEIKIGMVTFVKRSYAQGFGKCSHNIWEKEAGEQIKNIQECFV